MVERILTADELAPFCGHQPQQAAYHLAPITDQGAQYSLAMDFDQDDEEDEDAPHLTPEQAVNPLYGIPFGVCMLTVRSPESDHPAGFLTFRRDIRRLGATLNYELKIFVFMVQPDARGQGYGSALALGALQSIRDDIRLATPHRLNFRFVGEGKTPGGIALLNRTAKNIGLISQDFSSAYQSENFRIATNII
jgi:GNAT superfamily N-acetyltransferase